MIPLATTTITVLRLPEADLYAEPYAGDDIPERIEAGTVNAVIDRPNGRDIVAGGEQNISDYGLVCDEIELTTLDKVRDETQQIIYDVDWVHTYPGDHTEAGLRKVIGEV